MMENPPFFHLGIASPNGVFSVVMLVFFWVMACMHMYINIYIYIYVHDKYVLMVDSVRFVYTCIYTYIIYITWNRKKRLFQLDVPDLYHGKMAGVLGIYIFGSYRWLSQPESWQLHSFKKKLCSEAAKKRHSNKRPFSNGGLRTFLWLPEDMNTKDTPPTTLVGLETSTWPLKWQAVETIGWWWAIFLAPKNGWNSSIHLHTWFVFCFCFGEFHQVMVSWWFGTWWFGFVGSPSERDCYLGPLEFRTTNLPFLLIAGGCINFFFLHGPGPWSSVQRHANSVAKCWMTVLISPSGRMVAAYWPRRFPIQRPFFWTQVFQRLFFWENKITPGQN